MRYGAFSLFVNGCAYVIRTGWYVFRDALFPRRKALSWRNAEIGVGKTNLMVNWEDCIGCRECESVCPVCCISIQTRPATEREDLGITGDGRKKTEWVLEFDIDMSKCLLCGLCVDPCPTACISTVSESSDAVREREMLIYHFTPFTPEKAFLRAQSENQSRLF